MTEALSAEALSDFSDLIFSRVSTGPKHQQAPAPDERTLELAARAAQAAPCHADKAGDGSPAEPFPVRFALIESRERLADLFEAALPPDADEAARAKARGKALKGPGCIAVIGRRPKEGSAQRLAAERLMTAGAALMNFLNVLHAAGFAAKTVSAKDFADPARLYDPAEETLLAFILCGTPDGALPARKEKPSLLARW